MRSGPVFLMLLLACAPAHASGTPGDWPRVVELRFEGNDVTREEVLLREMNVAVGDAADPLRIVQSRQAIMDLGLFRSVEIHSEPVDGGVMLTVRMHEKRFLLPVPRIDVSSDGDYSYGMQLRWNNLWGLDHTFNAFAEQSRHTGDRLRERERRARMSYDAPYLFGERDGISASVEHLERVVPGPDESYDETIDNLEFLWYRDFRDPRPRRGWIGIAGVLRQTQRTAGESAPPSDGDVTALVFGTVYSNVRFHLHSEAGRRFTTRLERAQDGWLSDYGYSRLDAEHVEFLAVGERAHHSLIFVFAGGWATGGTGISNTYALGGSGRLRGYEFDFIQGERFAYAAAEYLHPLFGRDWLRLFAVFETGATGGSVTDARTGGPYSSIGLGVRLRAIRFVNVEIEAGLAYPLRGGDGIQVFAGGN